MASAQPSQYLQPLAVLDLSVASCVSKRLLKPHTIQASQQYPAHHRPCSQLTGS